jgi:FlgN protein
MNTELHSLYDSLVSVLNKEIEVYRKLHDSLLNEKEILAGSSVTVNELYENNSRKETCILKAKMVKTVRTKLLEKIITALNLDGRDIRLSTLLPHGDENQKKELEECQFTLCSLLKNIKESSKTNKALLVDSLFYVRKSIDFLGQIISPCATYLSTGRLKANNVNGKIVSREG